MSVNTSLIVLSKNKWYSYVFRWFLLKFCHDFGWFFATRIRIRFIEADPDPADQNETDLYGSGSETLPWTVPFGRLKENCSTVLYSHFSRTGFSNRFCVGWYLYFVLKTINYMHNKNKLFQIRLFILYMHSKTSRGVPQNIKIWKKISDVVEIHKYLML